LLLKAPTKKRPRYVTFAEREITGVICQFSAFAISPKAFA
jgi:hypothetical protein